MKIINVSVDIESQRLSSRSTSSQKNEHNENVSEQQRETKTPQKKARTGMKRSRTMGDETQCPASLFIRNEL